MFIVKLLKTDLGIYPTNGTEEAHSRVFPKLVKKFGKERAEELDDKIVAAIMAAPITKDGMFAHLDLSQDELKALLQIHILRQTGGTFSFN